MNRRSFFSKIASTIAAVAVAQGVVRSWLKPLESMVKAPVPEYAGKWQIMVSGVVIDNDGDLREAMIELARRRRELATGSGS